MNVLIGLGIFVEILAIPTFLILVYKEPALVAFEKKVAKKIKKAIRKRKVSLAVKWLSAEGVSIAKKRGK